MPRKWTNGGGGGGGTLNHRFVESTPVRTVNHKGYPIDLRFVDTILAQNAKLEGKVNKFKARR
jgi:hypothetical protein